MGAAHPAAVSSAPGLLDRERIIATAGFNRWLVPPAALAIHLCIGMAYGFSVFWKPLQGALVGADGKPLPGVAPVAKQQGQYVAALLKARLRGTVLPPFRYRDFGNMATIGRKRAVAQLGRVKLAGFPAWLLWSLAHIYFLIGFRNRLAVALSWGWNYLTFQRGTRLITGVSGSRMEAMGPSQSRADPMRGAA
jgi:hypothetical protein